MQKGYWKDGIYHFQGIPYAVAKRFMPPEKYQWEGVYKASRFGRKSDSILSAVCGK